VNDNITQTAMTCLDTLAIGSSDFAAWGAYAWLQNNEAGMPYVALLEDNARQDARFWAETASLAELECYFLASADKLAGPDPLFSSRQIKRLSGALWRRMSPKEQAAFVGWITGQLKGESA